MIPLERQRLMELWEFQDHQGYIEKKPCLRKTKEFKPDQGKQKIGRARKLLQSCSRTCSQGWTHRAVHTCDLILGTRRQENSNLKVIFYYIANCQLALAT